MFGNEVWEFGTHWTLVNHKSFSEFWMKSVARLRTTKKGVSLRFTDFEFFKRRGSSRVQCVPCMNTEVIIADIVKLMYICPMEQLFRGGSRNFIGGGGGRAKDYMRPPTSRAWTPEVPYSFRFFLISLVLSHESPGSNLTIAAALLSFSKAIYPHCCSRPRCIHGDPVWGDRLLWLNLPAPL